MRIHVIQHVPFEGPAAIADWAARRGDELRITHQYKGEGLPAPAQFDLLVSMGGPMGANDDLQHPWLTEERDLLRRTAAAGVPVLGICLGAQILCTALGGTVTRNPVPEIGFFPVRLTNEGKDAPALRGLPDIFGPLHWHGDTFSIPEGAIHAASSIACSAQAFVHGKSAVGLQFHLEATAASLNALIEHCGDELVEADTVQSAEGLRADMGVLKTDNELLFRLLDNLAAL